jgi:hypothetical protein
MAYPAAPVQRSSTLGVVSLIVMLLATAASIVAMVMITGTVQTAIDQTAHDGQLSNYDQALLQSQVGGPSILLNVAGFAGFVCWVLAIVATATKRGRAAGIWGIVLGVVAPVGIWSYFFFAVYQSILQYQG